VLDNSAINNTEREMSKHTPGPWEWDGKVWDYDHFEEAPYLVQAPWTAHDSKTILEGAIRCESEADARLIAAAPELLRALKQMIAWEDGERTEIDAMVNARAIVAKAEGQ
jgi:hypothetical protein